MNINYINEFELTKIINTHNTILIVKKDDDQVFKMMKVQVNKIKKHYQDKFKYFIVESDVATKVLQRNFFVFPQLVIMNKRNVVASIRGFRKVDVPTKLIELNF